MKHIWSMPWLQRLFSPKITVVCLSILLVLTFWGTLYQVDHGLYAAQERFFNSWIIWLGGFVPLPGSQLVLFVLLINLLGYSINLLIFEPLRPGILLIHLGLLILLLGGAKTRYFAEESYLSLWEGETSNVSASYIDWELALWTNQGIVRDVIATDADTLRPGERITFGDTGITAEVEVAHRNARAFQSTAGPGDLISSFDIARIEGIRRNKDPVQDVFATILRVEAPGQEPVRLALFGEDISSHGFIGADGLKYHFNLRHKRKLLPIQVTLLDFNRSIYPGTEIAREFSSLVEIEEGGFARRLTISMNKPLRHRGFTFYQQSYQERPTGEQASTFAVAKNYGRLLPYVSTGIIFIGMTLHFSIMLVQRAKRIRGPA
ncbi:MAG TPA: cytochrome c biogenesis protein ResB [Kiritimatiellia bacterium]|nr:cytochrome c biogenesis protein ResB [Kiritimatiellia bacterium]